MSDVSHFLDIALREIGRGFAVHPLRPGNKQPLTEHGWHDASKDETQIRDWWSRWPNANVGIACGPSGIAVLDCDYGLEDEAAFVEWRNRNGLPVTYTVRTGRPGFGVQLYYLGAVPDVGLWELDGCSGQIKSAGGYVLADGCLHPSGAHYEVLNHSLDFAVPIPDVVRSLKTSQKHKDPALGEPFKKLSVGEGQHDYMTRIAGKLRNTGLDKDGLLAALIDACPNWCDPPLSEKDLAHIADSISKKPLPAPERAIIIGGKSTAPEVEEVDTSLDEEIDPNAARPRYDDSVWDGTFYADFADLCGEGNNIPRKFFVEGLRTAVGAIVGERLSCGLKGVNPRSFTIFIAPPGMGKGTTCGFVQQLFGERWDGIKRTESGLLWHGLESMWKAQGIGAQIINPSSAPGLMIAMAPKTAKDKTPNPMQTWTPMPRVITIMEEVRGLFEATANENSGASLEGLLCELFDDTNYASTVTGKRQGAGERAMYSLLGGLTKELWDAIFSKTRASGSGFLSRVNIIATEGNYKQVGTIPEVDFTPLRNRFFPIIEDLIQHPRQIPPAPSAKALMDQWYADLEMPEGITRSRLNIVAWRAALHLAWLTGSEFILDTHVEKGIRLAEFQRAMRIWHSPAEGETRPARCQNLIRKTMQQLKRCTVRELRRRTNAHRWGIADWGKALDVLVKAGEVRIEVQSRAKLVILLKQLDL